MCHSLRLGVAGTAILALAFVVGCEKPVHEARVSPPSTSEPMPALTSLATTQPGDPTPAAAVLHPASNPAETQPLILPTLTIDGAVMQFPATKLVLRTAGDRKNGNAELFSDLPKSALRKYDGNELYLAMTLTLPDGSAFTNNVDGTIWRFKAPNSEKSDSLNGIFLAGQTTQLQPFDVLVKIERQPGPSGQMSAQIMGQFRAYQSGTPDALAPFVGVSGRLPVELAEKR